jgi:hypothetical protein
MFSDAVTGTADFREPGTSVEDLDDPADIAKQQRMNNLEQI